MAGDGSAAVKSTGGSSREQGLDSQHRDRN